MRQIFRGDFKLPAVKEETLKTVLMAVKAEYGFPFCLQQSYNGFGIEIIADDNDIIEAILRYS